MEELAAQTYCQRAQLELVALLKHQRKPSGRVRRESALLRSCVERALAEAPAMEHLQEGPWKVGTRPLKRPGRGGLKFIPTAHYGDTVIMVTTPKEAEELVAFLNYCRMQDLKTR